MLLMATLSATLLLGAACSSTPPPLGDGGTPGEQCVPGVEGNALTTGLYDLHNTGTSPATVVSVSLGSARGLKITSKPWLMPIFHDPKNGNWDVIGVGASYPPATWPEWPRRQSAIGAVIRPGQDLNLVFAMVRTWARAGRSAGPVVVYTADGNTYTLRERTGLMVAAGDSC
jgi:hypothetical protein